jgi:hypothetical protein
MKQGGGRAHNSTILQTTSFSCCLVHAVPCLAYSITLKMKAACFLTHGLAFNGLCGIT